jgi:hypothetical protein
MKSILSLPSTGKSLTSTGKYAVKCIWEYYIKMNE